jgi:hypothetical protein
MNSACFQVRTALARSTRSIRSILVHAGRLMCRLRMITGFWRSAFSATSSDLLLARSVTVPKMSGHMPFDSTLPLVNRQRARDVARCSQRPHLRTDITVASTGLERPPTSARSRWPERVLFSQTRNRSLATCNSPSRALTFQPTSPLFSFAEATA